MVYLDARTVTVGYTFERDTIRYLFLFDGLNANAGTTTKAFYCYPCKAIDAGFLILKGLYTTVSYTHLDVYKRQASAVIMAGDPVSARQYLNNVADDSRAWNDLDVYKRQGYANIQTMD